MNQHPPTALVTGASSGLGETFARALARRGYRVLLAARRKRRLEELAREMGNAEALPADLSLDEDVRRLERRIAAEPRLDILVNNAGFGVPGRFHEAGIEDIDRMHRVHVLAVERLTHAALGGMVRRGEGGIINVSSVAGLFHTLNSTAYCSTKAWTIHFTEGLYLELRSIGSPVRVQALCPGFTVTEFHDVIGMDRSLIHKRLWMRAEDVVGESLRGLEANRLLVIPGWQYRLFVGLTRCMPRRLRHRIAIQMGDPRT